MTYRPADVVVVGAGPAGSSLAWRLATAGVRVDLVDARDFPRSKPCGDAVSPGAVPILSEMGVDASLRAAGATRLKGWRIRAPDGRWFEGRFAAADSVAPAWGFAVARAELDARLLETAIGAGARFLPRSRALGLIENGRVRGVRVRNGAGSVRELRARLIVGADGLRSVIARRLGGVRRGRRARLAIVGRFAGVTGTGDLGAMRVSAEGCLGMAPIGEGRLNVTVVVPAAAARQISHGRWDFYRDRLRSYGVLNRLDRGELSEGLQVTGPFELSPLRVSRAGALLVGDAAGYFDPFTGQGVYRALVGGKLAANAALAILQRPLQELELLASYERALRRFLRPGRRLQRLVDGAVTTPVLIQAAGHLFRAFPGIADLLVDATGDRLPPSALLDAPRAWRATRRRSRWARERRALGTPEGRPGPRAS